MGLAGVASLRAVNEWIGIIDSNLVGSNRTAYKSTKISFGGGVTNIKRDPRQGISGVQIPDSTLSLASTRIDFGQGSIVQDGELTHFAIQGDGFFAIHDGKKVFYTRDGDFRWSVINSQTILTTAAGLTVLGTETVFGDSGQHLSTNQNPEAPAIEDVWHMNPNQPFYNGQMVWFTGNPATWPSTNPPIDPTIPYYIRLSSTFPGGLTYDFQLYDNEGATVFTSGVNIFDVLVDTPSTAITGLFEIKRIGTGATYSTTTTTVTGADIPIAVMRFTNNQSLKFSRFGSTIFDADNAKPYYLVFSDVTVVQSALEVSNAALNDTLPELALAQKLFSAVSKIINVHNGNLDTVVNLIR